MSIGCRDRHRTLQPFAPRFPSHDAVSHLFVPISCPVLRHSFRTTRRPPPAHIFCFATPRLISLVSRCPVPQHAPRLLVHASCFATPRPAPPTARFLIHTSAPFCRFPPPTPFGINPSSSAPFRPVPPPIHSPPAPAPARHRSSPFIFRLRFRDYSLPPLLHGTTSSQDRIESGEG